jgi:alanine-synthesizing transaminase
MTGPRFSRRLPWTTAQNRWSEAIAAHRASSRPLFDLTVSNPTRVGLDLFPGWSDLLAEAAAPDCEQDPLGLLSAREALAAFLSKPDDPVDTDDLVLTASTSEAYSYLFKLCADPGDAVLAALPSYPLLESLAALDNLRLDHFRLERGRRWQLNEPAVAAALRPETRALVLVHPANPTGSFLLQSELEAALSLCAERHLPLVSDEVFADYPLGNIEDRGRAAAAQPHTLAFSLGGLSKSAALPTWKLGWIRIGGPRDERRRARAALSLIADTYLSVATPVQRALPRILAAAPTVQATLRDRLERNLSLFRAALGTAPALRLLEPEGGWSAVVRVPRWADDEETALRLLVERDVLVQPGYFFDFEDEGHLVVSLLPPPEVFDQGIARLIGAFEESAIPPGTGA